MKLKWVISLGAAALLAIAAIAWAAPTRSGEDPDSMGPGAPGMHQHGFGGRHMQGGPGWGSGRMARRSGRGRDFMRQLDLTDEQRQKIADLRDRQQRRAIQKRADLRIAGLDLRKLMRAEHADRVAINRQIDTISRIKTDLRKSQVETLLDVREVLTPEQQKKLRDLRGGWTGADG